LPERARNALVAARENGDATTALLERPRKHFHHRRLARSAHTEIADADHLTAEGVVAENPMLPEAQPDLDAQLVNLGQPEQDRARGSRDKVSSAFEYHVEYVLLDAFSPSPHGVVYCRRRRCGSSQPPRSSCPELEGHALSWPHWTRRSASLPLPTHLHAEINLTFHEINPLDLYA
jgi:hypothetical protein